MDGLFHIGAVRFDIRFKSWKHGETPRDIYGTAVLGNGFGSIKKPATAGLFETISILSVINGVPGRIPPVIGALLAHTARSNVPLPSAAPKNSPPDCFLHGASNPFAFMAKAKAPARGCFCFGVPGRIRTSGLWSRSRHISTTRKRP